MYFQPRSERVISGVVLDARTERPIAGAVVVLRELQRPFLMFPFALDTWQPISSAVTNEKGAFHFDVCTTDWGNWLDWDDRGARRDPEWQHNDDGTYARLYSLTPPDGKPTNRVPEPDEIDSTMTGVCKWF